jgi:dephospho-CoA kinase
MLKIGLTGGIGSGKTTVAKVFQTLGIPVYYADDAAKELMNKDENLKQQIKQHFGEDAYENDLLNRQYLAKKVFNNPTQLELLNSIVHPATIQAAEDWFTQQTAPYCIKEAALIFESGSQQNLDYVIGVYTPTPLRLQRVMQRDKSTKEQVEQRMNKQIDETIKMRLCDYVINNNEQELVIPQVVALHENFLAMVLPK